MNQGRWTALWMLLSLLAGCGRLGVRLVAVSGPDAEIDSDEDGGVEEEDVGPPLTSRDASDLADAALDAGSVSSLALRYDFAGSGTMVQDRIGAAHGEIMGGAQLDGSGSLAFDGSNDFVNLPNGIISRSTSVTLMAWLNWGGGACWQRVFDFGSNSGGEDDVGSATSALSLSPASCPNNVVTGLFELNSDLRAANGGALNAGTSVQVALVMDGTRSTLATYVNGVVMGETAVPWQLSQLSDVNNWLGRSQWMQDRFLQGRIDEFRIYDAALSASQIAALNARGPNAP